jgi:nucleotide-binding universal stress UspA family protein
MPSLAERCVRSWSSRTPSPAPAKAGSSSASTVDRGGGRAPLSPGRDLTGVDAALQLEAAVPQARDRRRGPTKGLLVYGSTSTNLVMQAVDADLLLVGSRGTNAVRALLFGSVSERVTAHSTCPVVVIRDLDGDRASRRRGGSRYLGGGWR